MTAWTKEFVGLTRKFLRQAVDYRRHQVRGSVKAAASRAVAEKVHLKQTEKTEKAVTNSIAPMFERQVRSAAERLKLLGESKSVKSPTDSALSLTNLIFDQVEWNKELVDRALPPLAKGMAEAMKSQMILMGVDPKKGFKHTPGILGSNPHPGQSHSGSGGAQVKWEASLSSDQKRAISDWSEQAPEQGSSKPVYAIVRTVDLGKRTGLDELSKGEIERGKKRLSSINKAVDSAPDRQEGQKIFRGESTNQPENIIRNIYVPGMEMRLDAISSFSSDKGVASGFSTQITRRSGLGVVFEVNKGKTGAFISGVTTPGKKGEAEYLLPKGVRFRITSVRRESFTDPGPLGRGTVEFMKVGLEEIGGGGKSIELESSFSLGRMSKVVDKLENLSRFFDSGDDIGVFFAVVSPKKSILVETKASTASDWLDHNPDLDLAEVIFDTPQGPVSMRVATEFPQWMKVEIEERLNETFEQDYWEGINQTTSGDIESVLQIGLRDGKSILQMAEEMVPSLLEVGDYALNRAIGIARTEAGHALNGARVAGIDKFIEDTQLQRIVKKVWLSVLGNTTRDTHANLHGVPADKDGRWALGGVRVRWPSDINLPVGERISCQCTVVVEFGMTDVEAEELILESEERQQKRTDGISVGPNARALRAKINQGKARCDKCKSKRNLVVHHIDDNAKNDAPSNLRILCRPCHQTLLIHRGFKHTPGILGSNPHPGQSHSGSEGLARDLNIGDMDRGKAERMTEILQSAGVEKSKIGGFQQSVVIVTGVEPGEVGKKLVGDGWKLNEKKLEGLPAASDVKRFDKGAETILTGQERGKSKAWVHHYKVKGSSIPGKPKPLSKPKIDEGVSGRQSLSEIKGTLLENGFRLQSAKGVGKAKEEKVARLVVKELERMNNQSPRLKKFKGDTDTLEAQLGSSFSSRNAQVQGSFSGGKLKIASGLRTTSSSSPDIGGFVVGSDMGSVFRHEYGHKLQKQSMTRKESDTWGKVSRKHSAGTHLDSSGNLVRTFGRSSVSVYGGSNQSELFSESFSAFTHPGYKRGSLPKEIEGYFDRFLN